MLPYFSRRKRNGGERNSFRSPNGINSVLRSGRSVSKARGNWRRLFLESLESRLAPATFSATEGVPFAGVVASVADPDPTAALSAFTATINWGDGSPISAGTISQPGGPGTNLVVSGSHTYVEEGNFQTSATITEGGTTALDFTSGFAGSTNLLTYNGNAKIVQTLAQLTDGGSNEAGSFFSTNKVLISNFSTLFSFQLLNAFAEGFTFCIQGSANKALGALGGGLGYSGIANSVAIKFDLHNNAGEGSDSTGLYTGGAAPTVPAIDLTGTGIDLHSGDIFNVAMNYAGGTLNVTIADAKTGASASQSYSINIPGTVGGQTAFVGFTGGTSGGTAVQNIRTWSYGAAVTTITAQVAEGDTLTATGGISWTATEGGSPISGTVATFTDTYVNNTVADLVATINWGDGTTSTGQISGAAGNFVVNAAHTFVDEGQLPVTVTITDDGAGTAMAVAQDSATVSETDVLTANVLSTNLVSLWKAEGNANDSAGPNNGTLQGGATFAPGKFGQAFSFDGLNSYVQAGTTGMPTGKSDRTLAMWVNISAFGSGESWFAGYGDFGTNTLVYSLGTNPTTHTLFFSQWGSTITGPALQTGKWYYVAATNVGNFATLYLNGVAVASGTLPINTPPGTSFYMGRIPGLLGNTRSLNGFLDEVAVFNRALSATEIQTAMSDVFNATFTSTEGPTLSRAVASFTDTNKSTLPGDFAVTIDWGDGTIGPGTVSGSAGNYVVNGTHLYPEEGSYNYNVQVQEDGSGTAAVSISGTATVGDAPLPFTAIPKSPLAGVEGQSVSGLLGTFTDTDPLGTATDYAATINWGDGTTSTGTVVPSAKPSLPSLSVGANVNLSKETGNQNEASLSINPTNPNNIVAWSNDENTTKGGVNEYLSFDGGNTWTRKLIGAGDNLENSACCDTQSVFDAFGNFYAVNIDFLNSGADAIKVLESFDGGITFQVVTIATDPSTGLDQPSIAVGAGTVWVSYKDTTGGALMAAGAAVTGLGQVGAFSTPQAAPGSANGSFGDVAVGPNGQVMVTYQSPVAGAGPSTVFVNLDPDGLGPQGFGPAIPVTNTNVGGFDPIPPQPFRTIDAEANVYYDNSGGPHTGRAYLVYTDTPFVGSSITDIFVRTSDDNGMTWTSPVRITDDTSGNSHFLPQMAIDQTTGNVAVAWYDSRNAGSSDQTAQVFATMSSDGGLTWLPNIQVSAGTSNVIPSGSGIDYGDYMTMDFYAGTFRPIWSDNSNSTGDNPDGTLNSLDIYTAAVTVTTGPSFDVLATHTYADEGFYAAKVQVVDNAGSMGTTTVSALVTDTPLTAQGGAQFTSSEKTNYTGRVASFTDGNPNEPLSDYTATINWGNGNSSAGTVVANASGGFDVIGTNTYADEGTFAVSVTIQDAGGSQVTVNSMAQVLDLPLTGTGVSISTVEPKAISGQVATFQDALPNASLTDFGVGHGVATIDWGDGSTPSLGLVTQPGGVGTSLVVSGFHGYATEGKYLVTVTLTEEGGSSATAISTVIIADAPLLALGIVNPQPTEGNVFTGELAAFLDTNSQAPLSDFTYPGGISIDWGDGTPKTSGTVTQPLGPGTGFVISGNHTYLDEGAYTIHITVTDVGGAVFQTLVAAVVSDAALTGSGVAVNAFEGASFSGPVATFTDANPLAPLSDFPTGTGAVRIDWGDGIATRGTVSQPGGLGTPFVVSGSHTYAQVGVYTVQMTVADVGGNRVTASTTATVVDAPLTLSPAPLSLSEASIFSGTVATFTDANAAAPLADFTSGTGGATIDWGDGSSPTTAIVTQPQGIGTPFLVSSSHLYQEEGTYSITVTVQDRRGSRAQIAFTSSVADASLTAAGIPPKRFNGLTYTGLLATVSDANPTASLTDFTTGTAGATIDWGDGSPASAGTVTQPGGPGSAFVVQGTHTFANLGTYAIKVSVQDDGGSSAAASTSLTVARWDDLVGRSSQSGQWTLALSNGANAFTATPFGAWDPTRTWVDVQTGDFNGDGRTDIIGRDLQSGDWWVGLSNGSSFSTTKWATWSPAVTWVDVHVGDFNGDGKADIIGRVLQSGEWWVGLSTGSSFATAKWATWSPAVTWVDVNAGDFNGDGKADIVGRVLQSGEWWLGLSTGSSFTTAKWATWSPAVTWVDVKVGDFNGDGKADIVGRVLQSGEWWLGLSTGSSFTTAKWATWSPAVTWVDVHVGDFNGDGKADIIGRVLQSGEWWEGQSTGSSFSTSLWAVWNPNFTWIDVQVGDFNGDGKTDLAGLASETGALWTSLSTGTSGLTSVWGTSPQADWVDVRSGDFA